MHLARNLCWIISEIKKADNQPLLISNKDGAFSVGADLKEILISDVEQILDFIKVMEELFACLLNYPAPTVAAVDGHATGGGGLLFLCCDFAYCSDHEDIRIGFPEVSAGVLVSPTFMAQFKQLIPFPLLRKLLLSAELISPRKALQYGLFDEMGNDVTSMARQRLDYLSTLPQQAYAVTKAGLISNNPSQSEFEKQIQNIVSTGKLSEQLVKKFDNA